MQAPIPPSLKEFGLTEDAMVRLPKPWFGTNMLNVKMVGGVFAAISLTVLAIMWREGIGYIFLIIVGVLFIFPLALIPIAILFVFLEWVSKKILILLNDDFKKASAYWAACADYSRKKAEFDTWVRKKHEEYWRSLSGIEFENELGTLFTLLGYSVELTPKTGDGGVDILLRKNGRLIVVQCKAHNKRIPIGVARELSASMADFHANEAIIACFEGVTKPVAEYIKDKRITVMKLADIIELQRQHG